MFKFDTQKQRTTCTNSCISITREIQKKEKMEKNYLRCWASCAVDERALIGLLALGTRELAVLALRRLWSLPAAGIYAHMGIITAVGALL
jgi:hypothetical protein